MEKHIGLIGTGLMGYGIGSSLLENGYPLHISTHKNITNVKRLELKGAYVHDSIKEIAEKCNVIILCLPDAHSVEGVILGENGIYNHIKEGSVVLDCTTSDPNTTRLVGQALKNKGVELFDSPLNRSPKEAEEGRLNIIIGGNQSKLNRIMPILESFAENISYVGELGEAHKLKLFNNYISMALTATVISAIAYAKEEELDLNKLDEVM